MGALITYALFEYPIIGILLGHHYPAAPTFGVPCPTTIFTFGLLIGAGVNVRFYMLVIPLLWSVTGLWAAISLGMDEDLGLVIAGFSGVFIVLRHAQSKNVTRVRSALSSVFLVCSYYGFRALKDEGEMRHLYGDTR